MIVERFRTIDAEALQKGEMTSRLREERKALSGPYLEARTGKLTPEQEAALTEDLLNKNLLGVGAVPASVAHPQPVAPQPSRAPEMRNIPGYWEREKHGVLDWIPSRGELRSGVFDFMTDTADYSPRAARKTAEFLMGTTPGTDRSTMPIPDIGAADLLPGVMSKKFIDPFLLSDAQQARLEGDTTMAGVLGALAVAPPAYYAAKGARGVMGKAVGEEGVQQGRREFMRNAGLLGLATQLPAPVIKAASVAAEAPAAVAGAVGKAGKAVAGAMKASSLLKLASAAKQRSQYQLFPHTYKSRADAGMINPRGENSAYTEVDSKAIADRVNQFLKPADNEVVISHSRPGDRYGQDNFDELIGEHIGDFGSRGSEYGPISGKSFEESYAEIHQTVKGEIAGDVEKLLEGAKQTQEIPVSYWGKADTLKVDTYKTKDGSIMVIRGLDDSIGRSVGEKGTGDRIFYKVKKDLLK